MGARAAQLVLSVIDELPEPDASDEPSLVRNAAVQLLGAAGPTLASPTRV